MTGTGSRYLFWCAHEHLSFRIAEFEAIAAVFQIDLDWVEKTEENPWVIIRLDSEELAKKIASRSLATRFCVELWGDGKNEEDMHKSVKEYSEELKAPYFAEDVSFKIYVEVFMHKLSLKEKLKRVESFDYLPIKGRVKLDHPDVTFANFEFYGFDHNHPPEWPLRLFFGRLVAEGQRALISQMSIKKRKFIGNTTMDSQLALLCANLACVGPGTLVMDPFCGTGSLLLAAARFGAFVLGTDIDYLMLHARTRPSRVGMKRRAQDESIIANFEQYGLESKFLNVVVCDASRDPWRKSSAGLTPTLFDAVIADPPYGIREPTTRVGTEKKDLVIAEEYLKNHVPEKVEYQMGDLYLDLMNFAAEHLCESGRLVFWVPIVRESYSDKCLPRHPRLRLVANCEQVLSSHTSRRLLVMEKVNSMASTSMASSLTALSSSAQVSSESEEEASTISLTASEFREHFYQQYSDISRKQRKERLRKFGHLNLKERTSQDS